MENKKIQKINESFSLVKKKVDETKKQDMRQKLENSGKIETKEVEDRKEKQ